MRRVIVAAYLMALTASVLAADWPTVLDGIDKRVPRLQIATADGIGVCSGVVLNAKAGFVLTAAHCVASQPTERIDITVNARHGEIVRVNTILDLAIVRFQVKKEEAMPLADVTPPMGTPIAVVGYAFGVEEFVSQIGTVARSYNRDTHTMWINVDTIFGDSGGACIDAQGRLVGMTSAIFSRGPAHLGGVIPIEAIRDFVDSYLPAK